VDDAARALLHLMENYSSEEIINVAGGEDISIADLAASIAKVVGYTGGFHSIRPSRTGCHGKCWTIR